jgi:plasmid stability protein
MMTAITVRNIPQKLQEVIKRRADADGLSLNKTVIRMLEEAAGQRTTTGRELHRDLDHLAGTWSDEQAAAFEAALAEQRRVDPELWE